MFMNAEIDCNKMNFDQGKTFSANRRFMNSNQLGSSVVRRMDSRHRQEHEAEAAGLGNVDDDLNNNNGQDLSPESSFSKKDDDKPFNPRLTKSVQETAERRRTLLEAFRKFKGKKRLKRRSMLAVFLVSAAFSVAALARLAILSSHLGHIPSDNGATAETDALISFIGLFCLSVVGILIFYCRLGRLLVFGVITMLGALFVLITAIKGTTYASLSYRKDNIEYSMKLHARSHFHHGARNKVPLFYEKLQSICECCGFKDLDLLDWSRRLRTAEPYLPSSCCVNENSEECKSLNSKTLPGLNISLTRVPSGYVLYRSQEFMENLYRNGGPPSKLGKYKPSPTLPEGSQLTRFTLPEGQLSDVVSGLHLEIKTELERKYMMDGPHRERILKELKIRLDTFVEELIYTNQLLRGQSMYFRLPDQFLPGVEEDDYFVRDFPDDSSALRKKSSSEGSLFYISYGITTNFLLDGIIWTNRCERDVKLSNRIEGFTTCASFFNKNRKRTHYRPKSSGDYVNWKISLKWKRVDSFYGFYGNALKFMDLWILTMLSITIFLTFAIIILFWISFSRTQKVDLQGLAPPTDLELLLLDFYPVTDDMDEETKIAHAVMFHKLLKAEAKRWNKEIGTRKRQLSKSTSEAASSRASRQVHTELSLLVTAANED